MDGYRSPGLAVRDAIDAGRLGGGGSGGGRTGGGRDRAGSGGMGLERLARAGIGSQAGKLAGLPKFDHVLEAAEQADEAGLDQGLQRGGQPGPGGGFRAQVGQHGGDGAGQGRGGLI